MKDLCFKHREALRALVEEENLAQLEKWDVQDHEPFAWLAFATEELGELSEAIQTATLCLKIAEMFRCGGRNGIN